MSLKTESRVWVYFSMSIMIIIGLLCFLISLSKGTTEITSLALLNIGSIAIISGIYEIMNKSFLLKNHTDLILNKIDLKQDIDKMGLKKVYSKINDIDFNYYIKNAKNNIDIIHIYGYTWTKNHIMELQEKLLKSKCSIRVFLLASDSLFLPAVAQHIGEDEESLKRRINEVIRMWENAYLEVSNRKRCHKKNINLTLYRHTAQPAYSLYKFDDVIIINQRSLSRKATQKLPAFIISNTNKNDDLYSVYMEQINELFSCSTKIFPIENITATQNKSEVKNETRKSESIQG